MSDRPPKPEPLAVDADGVPKEIRDKDRWICWRYGWDNDREEWTKKPVHVPGDYTADPTDPSTWSDFETACVHHQEHDTDGLGFALSDDDTIMGVDLDDARDPDTGDLLPWAAEMPDRLDTFTEVSPSGTGLHALGLGFVPDGGNRADVGDGEIELYDRERYFTVTGQRLDSAPESVEQIHNAVKDLHSDHIADSGAEDTDPEPANPTPDPDGSGVHDLGNDELIEKAKEADDGGKFRQLWQGDTSGYESHSEAQQALANKLAFWTGGDRQRMVRLFKRSNMIRGDDDLRKFKNYDMDTALEGRTEFYDPKATGGGTAAVSPEAGKSLDFDMVLDRAPSEPSNDRERAYYGYEVIQDHPDHHFLATYDGQLYYYENGRWIPDGKQKLRQLGTDLFEASWGANLLSETKEQIRSKDAIRREELGTPKRTVAVKNGLLHVDTGELEDHSKDHLALNKLPVEYDPDAEAPRWRQFLNESVEDGMQDAVEEYIGYTLLEGEMPFARALLLVGGGSNGKSTFLNTVIELLGEENITGFSLGDLSHNEYYAAEMFGALANIDADVTGGIGHGGMFKKLTGGDRKVSARRPYGEPFDFHPTTKQLYSANKVPDAKVDDDAFFRRWLIVEFPTEFTDSHLEGPDKDPDLEEKLKDELPGILNRAVDGVQRLLEQGHFTNEGEIYEKRERWQEWGNTVDKFMANCIETGNDDKIKAGELHSIYSDYCRAELGEEPESQATLTGEMKKQDGVKYSSDFRFDGKKGRGFKGVTVTWDGADHDGNTESGQFRLPQADAIDTVRAVIETHQNQNGDLADVETVLDKLDDKVGRDRAEKVIQKLEKRGDIHEPEAGQIELIN